MVVKNKAMSLALGAILEVSPDIPTLNKSNIVGAWKECKELFGKSLQLVPKVSHVGVLEGDWLEVNSKKLNRITNKYLKEHTELNIESFQGKLTLKLPGVPFPKDMKNYDKASVRWNVAAIFIELLIDNGVVTVRVDTKGKGKHTRNHTMILFGGTDQPVDLLTGLCDGPGEMLQTKVGPQRLPAADIWRLQKVGSMAFKLSHFCIDEMVLHGYQLSAEYNSESVSERSIHRHDRHDNKYIDAIGEIRKKEQFYLPMFFDHRGRQCYYFAKVFGVRPGGKLWETQMLDRAVPKVLSPSCEKHLKHIIYCYRHGKFSVEHAVKHFKDADYEYAKSVDPLAVEVPDVPYGKEGQNARLYRKAEAEFGKRIVLNKAADALDMYEDGDPCPYIFGKDLANSGLIMTANSFRSEKMLRGANLWALKGVTDSHMQFGIAHKIDHLPRAEIKDIHTPLLHGSSVRTIVAKLHEHVPNPEDFNESNVHRHNVDAYGEEVNNIEIIAAWGADVVTNHQNILKWKMPDGFPACHKAMMKRTPFNVYAATPRMKKLPYREYKVMATMPLALDADGRCSFGRDNTTAISSKGVDVGTRGLFADLTHGIDGMLLRYIQDMLLMVGEVALFKHDDYMVSPDMFDEVIETCQDYFVYLQAHNLYADAMEQISKTLKKPSRAPKLFKGKAAPRVLDSFNFLMP